MFILLLTIYRTHAFQKQITCRLPFTVSSDSSWTPTRGGLKRMRTIDTHGDRMAQAAMSISE
jgi:hypothetical protein